MHRREARAGAAWQTIQAIPRPESSPGASMVPLVLERLNGSVAIDPGQTIGDGHAPSEMWVFDGTAFLPAYRHDRLAVSFVPAFDAEGMLIWGFTGGLLDKLLMIGGWEREWDQERYVEIPPPYGEGRPRSQRRVG